MSTIEIFCCYVRKDQSLLNELKTHLIPLQRRGLINVWSDTDISPGREREEEIKKHLRTAQIILLLVSPDFLASDYCYSNQMSQAMERHERGEVCVIPVILRHAIWHNTPFGKLEALPTGANPVTGSNWRNRNVAFHSVAEGVRKAVEELTTEFTEITETIPDPIITALGKMPTSSTISQTPLSATSPKTKKHYGGNAIQLTKLSTEMLAAYDQAIRLDPADAYAYTLKGDALYDLERYEEAHAAYDQAIRLDPDNPYIYIFKGHTLNDLERYEEALAAYEQANQRIPDNAFVQGCKGIILYDLERFEEALAACNQSIYLNPNDPFIKCYKGMILFALDCSEEALDAYDQSIHLDPNEDFVYHLKGDALYDLERYEEALAAYEQAAHLDPNYASAYKGKGNALYELKRYKDALAAYNRAIRLNPHEADAHVGKGNTLKRIVEDQKKLRKGEKKSRTSAEVDRRHE